MYPNHNNHLAAHKLRQAELERAARHEHLIRQAQEKSPKTYYAYLAALLSLIGAVLR